MGNLVPEFFLHIHVLTDAFDDQVSVCKAGFVVGKCDQFDEYLGFLLAYHALCHQRFLVDADVFL